MKKALTIAAMLGAVLSLTAAEAKLLRIPVGSLSVVNVPFKVENVSISNREIVRVETLSDRQVRISGLKIGVTDVQLLGSNMSQVYSVTVINDIRETFNALKRDLNDISEIDLTINNGRIVLRGEINNIANWILKRKVVAAYGPVILDLTTYHPTPEVMLSLQKNFEKAGFRIVRRDVKPQPGELVITQVGEMLTITGSVYNPADLKTIDNILKAQPWLTLNTSATMDDRALVKGFVNVQVMPVMLQVDIVHIAVSRDEARGLGVDWSAFVNKGFGVGTNLMYALQKIRGADTIKTANSAIGAGTNGTLQAWLKLLGENNITRGRRAGFLTFKSNDTPEFRKLHNGGTFVISSDAVSGSTSTLKEYDYGLILQVKGGLTGVDTVSIELKQELSYPGPISPYVNDAKLELKKFETSTSFTSRLGETIAIAGMKEFTQANTNTASIPYLRNVPVLKWFISQEDNKFKDDEVITLICVHKMNPSGSIDPVAVELEKMKQAEDKNLKAREAAEHKNDGKWYQFWKW